MSYKSKFTGEEVDKYLQKAKDIEVDTYFDTNSMNPIANGSVTRRFINVESKLEGITPMLTIAPLSGSGVIAKAFEELDLANRVGEAIPCLIKKDNFEKYYTQAVLTVESFGAEGYRLNFVIMNADSGAIYSEENGNWAEAFYKPDCVFGKGRTIVYNYNPQTGYVFPLGDGKIIGVDNTYVIDYDMIKNSASDGAPVGDVLTMSFSLWERITGLSRQEFYDMMRDSRMNFFLKVKTEDNDNTNLFHCISRHEYDLSTRLYFDSIFVGKGFSIFSFMNPSTTQEGDMDVAIRIGAVPATIFTESDKESLINKQERLVSGKNIKTVNGQSILGEGNIEIEGGGEGHAVLYTEQSLTDAQKEQARENIGVESDVFKAIYGVTTYEEIKAAYDSGKVVHCDYLDYCYVLSRLLSVAAYFDAMSAPNSFRIVCDNNGWTNTTILLESRTDKVTSLSSSSTDTQYPSAKAVYDAIEAVKEKDYELLLDVTFEEDVESFNASAVAPRLLECKDFIVLIEFLYDENKTNRSGYIRFKNGSLFPSARIESVVTASYLTHYILRIHLGQGFDKTASIESHTNAFDNPQYGTPKGNIMGVLNSDAPWDMFDFQFGFFANEKIRIYGK